jgi:hypothetical protein
MNFGNKYENTNSDCFTRKSFSHGQNHLLIKISTPQENLQKPL